MPANERTEESTGRGSRPVVAHTVSKGGADGDNATGLEDRVERDLLAVAIGAQVD
jgi:hypothetical protein